MFGRVRELQDVVVGWIILLPFCLNLFYIIILLRDRLGWSVFYVTFILSNIWYDWIYLRKAGMGLEGLDLIRDTLICAFV